MFTILYLGLLVMCSLPWYLHKKMQYSTDYNKICVAGMICSVLAFLWSLIYVFDSIGVLFAYESIFENMSNTPELERVMWTLHGDVMREAEGNYGLTIFLIYLFIALLILSGYSFFKYSAFWQSCYKKCPKCNEKIKVKAKLCHYCGYEFSEDDNIQNIQKKTYLSKFEVNTKNPFSYYILSFKNYSNFSGKSSRREYWYTALAEFLIFSISYLLMGILAGIFQEDYEGIISLYLIITTPYSIIRTVPSWSLIVRRLHDSGKSGWLALIQLIPYIGWILIILFMLMKSQQDETTLPFNNTNSCRKCGTELVDVKFCADCKGVIKLSQTQLNEEKLCPKCGQAMINEKYCTTCKTVIRKKIHQVQSQN